ncbi:MAG: hypothetical protein E7672_09035 [Ruminococcaceae bacterium]|nr:hypothetical protein [Oscillospiraceae bacterium]
MTYINALLLLLSISFGSGRNLLSKRISSASFGKKKFFSQQGILFAVGTVVLLILRGSSLKEVAPITVVYSVVYALCLIISQWCYTMAMQKGDTSICSTVFSFGFIPPIIFGIVVWSEAVSILKFIGMLVVIPAIILSSFSSDNRNKVKIKLSFMIPIIIAMSASGGLGIMQKVQQRSEYPDQLGAFLIISFAISGVISLISAMIVPSDNDKILSKEVLSSSFVGVFFAANNLLNTTLVGRLPSAVFFPIFNIGVILMSLILSIVLYKEKFTKKKLVILLLGVTSIMLISLS